MTRTALSIFLVAISFLGNAQIKLMPGPYTSPDGRYTIMVTLDEEKHTLTTVEPNATTVYNYLSGNDYQYIHTNGTDYRIGILTDRTFRSYHPGVANSAFVFTYTGAALVAATSGDFVDFKKVADKYKDKMKTDPDNIQAYAFCATAAIARGMYNEEGFVEYCKKIVASLKLIVSDKTKCPCEDAIPQKIWDSIKN